MPLSLRRRPGSHGPTVTKLLQTTAHQSWLPQEVPAACTSPSLEPIRKKGWKEEPRNYRSVILRSYMAVILTWVLRKGLKQIILGANTQHREDNQVLRLSQHMCAKDRPSLTNLISFRWMRRRLWN